MFAYTIRRIVWIIPVLWVIATLTFFLMYAVPGGPFTQEKERPPQLQAALEREYGLDQPVWRQYTTYMGNLLQGDLGISFQDRRPVADTLQRTGFISMQVAVLSLAVACFVGISLGTISALRHNGPIDYAGVMFATIGASVPNFILGAFMVIVFSINLGWFDQFEWGGPERARDLLNPSAYDWNNMVMPVVALAALPAAYIARVTRASVLEVLHQDYVRTARAKGLHEYRVVVRHTLKNALIPVLTVLGPITALLLSGSFIIENMFNINGIGSEYIEAVQRRDYGLIMGTTVLFAFLVATMNLIVDLLYAAVDPRIRYR